MRRRNKTIVARAAMTLLVAMLTLLAPTKANAWGYDVIEGTQGANENEECEKLFDGDIDTKWCVSDFGEGVYVEFSTTEAIAPKYYILTTGNDTKGGKRNPKTWYIYASNDGDIWNGLAQVVNASMPSGNKAQIAFSISNPENNAYKYFRFEIYDIQDVEENVFELSEFQFAETGLTWSGVGGYCGNTLENVYFEKATINDKKTLTIQKNPNATTDDFKMKDYDNDENEESVFAPWISANPYYDYGSEEIYFLYWVLSCDIQEVVIEEGVTRIGNGSFYKCSDLTSVTIPASVTSIGEYAFKDCNHVSDVYCYAKPDALTWATCYEDFNSSTQFHVYGNQLANYQTKFSNARAQFVGDIPAKTCVINVTASGETKTSGVHELPYSKTLRDCVPESYASLINDLTISDITKVGSNVEIGDEPYDWDTSFTVTDEGTSTVTITASGQSIAFSVTATRVFSVPANSANDAYWATFYSSEANFQAPEATQVLAVKLDGTTISLTEITDGIVNQGQGVVLKKETEGAFVMTKTESNSTGDYSTNSLEGTDIDVIGQSNAYVLGYSSAAGVGFYKLKTDGVIRANRAYLTYSDGARDFFGFGEETGISLTPNPSPNVEGSIYYTVDGRRVSQPTKGLYIVNGKKVIIK